jgi:hypothetical protein
MRPASSASWETPPPALISQQGLLPHGDKLASLFGRSNPPAEKGLKGEERRQAKAPLLFLFATPHQAGDVSLINGGALFAVTTLCPNSSRPSPPPTSVAPPPFGKRTSLRHKPLLTNSVHNQGTEAAGDRAPPPNWESAFAQQPSKWPYPPSFG